ncbi:sensor histidine kinase YesM [Anaerocolumna cellulosilytica]|uniref:Sensor histidine kinase YesM n=1 Tax=Anaerocolumna cellulosilytica TaxID=433286 RepID=A0A6S6R3D2_9FIRM|nr:sensor histidine kinase [Anaerocolumna cellulosilytica]MBB5195626.1 two-component system sensor histidine kinase YesM [Anaerocolumna cellulosilytica]BCJ93870.1 sensor histidine kinase YesM [Anaerocolumna cellulosilytica]
MKKKNNIWSYIKNYKFNSMFIRTFLLVFIMFSIPFFLLNDLYYRDVERIAKDEIIMENNSLLYGVRDISDTILSDCDMLCTYISYNDNVQMFMVNDWFTDLNSKSMKEFTQLVKAIPLIYKYIDSIYVYSEYNNSVYIGERKSPLKELKDISWLEEYNKLEDVSGRTISRLKNNNYPKIISIIKPIIMDHEKKGAVILNINSEKLHNIITTEKYQNQSKIYLYNDSGNIIMSSEEKQFGNEIKEISYLKDIVESGNEASVIKNIDGMDSVISITPSAKFGFTYISITSMFHYQNKLNQLKSQILLLIILLVVLSIVFAYFAAIRSYKPVAEIITVLEEPQKFNNYSDPAKARLNELRYIISTILKQIQANEIMKDELESKLKLLDQSQFAMLQSQINPHFLYNTLETINWMAFDLTKSENNVSKAVNSLAQLFRNNVYLGDYIIPIEQEIDNTKNYLDILELRYGDIFKVIWDIDEGIKNYSIIKICLQPIIENAVYHGLKPKGREGLLKICGELSTDKNIHFCVRDNGVGMNSIHLAEMNRKLNDRENQMEDHIGIYNVNQRIKIVFGEEYGVSIKSEEHQGTEVFIKIPLVHLH